MFIFAQILFMGSTSTRGIFTRSIQEAHTKKRIDFPIPHLEFVKFKEEQSYKNLGFI